MVNQHGNFHIFRTQSYNTSSWPIYKKLMKDKKLSKKAKIPLENHFFNQSIKAQQKHVFEDLLGWVRWVYKIEFQHRGHPHIHAAEFLGKHGHDLYKIFKNDGTNLDDVKGEIEKMHKCFNRFVTRMNYLSQ